MDFWIKEITPKLAVDLFLPRIHCQAQITLEIQETIGLIGTKSEIRMTHGLDGTNNETTRNGLDLTEINVTLNDAMMLLSFLEFSK